jgi:hypothetical protein
MKTPIPFSSQQIFRRIVRQGFGPAAGLWPGLPEALLLHGSLP